MTYIKLSCPECGKQGIEVSTEVKSYDQLVSTICRKCNAIVSKQAIKQQIMKLAEELGREGFGDGLMYLR